MSVTVGVGVRNVLLADAGVAALVSDRVRPAPLRGPDEPGVVLPAVTYQRVGSERPMHMEGRGQPTKIDCWALDHDAAEVLFDAVRIALDMKGSEAYEIQLMELVDGSDQFLPEPDTKLSRFTCDFWISHVEATS